MGGYKKHAPTIYVVFKDDVVKVGFTEKQRWRKFVLLGCELLATYEFETAREAFDFETFGHAWLRSIGAALAFSSIEASAGFVGPDGGGYAECYSLDRSMLGPMLEHLAEHAPKHGAKHQFGSAQAMHATNATYATN